MRRSDLLGLACFGIAALVAMLSGGASATGRRRSVVHLGPTVYSSLEGSNCMAIRCSREGWYWVPGYGWISLNGSRQLITNKEW